MEPQIPQPTAQERASRWAGLTAGLTRNVVVLGVVSLFTDISSEMLVPIRFLFLVRWLGTPLVLAALIEGISEAASSLLKFEAGRRADRVQRRAPLLAIGYSLSNLAKPLIGFAQTWPPALGLILTDRVGKAIRGAPRDTIIADSTPLRYRGKAFGFHRSMDTLGAAIGPLATVAILDATGGDLPAVFRWTIVPGIIAILVIPAFLREPRREPKLAAGEGQAAPAIPLGRKFWLFTAIWMLFSLGNSSDSFIFLRSVDLDSQLIQVPLYYAAFNITYALFATPLGAWSDRIGRLPLLVMSLFAFALVYGGWGVATAGWQTLVLFLLYGLYYAATEGVARAYVVDLIPEGRRGTALGWFTALTGLATLPANLAAAYLWNRVNPSAPFFYGSAIALAAAIALALCYRWLRRASSAIPLSSAPS